MRRARAGRRRLRAPGSERRRLLRPRSRPLDDDDVRRGGSARTRRSRSRRSWRGRAATLSAQHPSTRRCVGCGEHAHALPHRRPPRRLDQPVRRAARRPRLCRAARRGSRERWVGLRRDGALAVIRLRAPADAEASDAARLFATTPVGDGARCNAGRDAWLGAHGRRPLRRLPDRLGAAAALARLDSALEFDGARSPPSSSTSARSARPRRREEAAGGGGRPPPRFFRRRRQRAPLAASPGRARARRRGAARDGRWIHARRLGAALRAARLVVLRWERELQRCPSRRASCCVNWRSRTATPSTNAAARDAKARSTARSPCAVGGGAALPKPGDELRAAGRAAALAYPTLALAYTVSTASFCITCARVPPPRRRQPGCRRSKTRTRARCRTVYAPRRHGLRRPRLPLPPRVARRPLTLEATVDWGRPTPRT